MRPALLAFTLIVLACTGLGMSLPVRAADQIITLQLKWKHQFQFAGYYAALDKGYYRDAGLDVRILEASPDIDPVREVVEGRADFGVGTSALLLARHAGEPVVVMAVIFQHSPYILLSRADRGIRSVEDLEGRRIMLEPRADEIRALLRSNELDEHNVQLLPHSFRLDDLTEGRADAIAAYSTDETFGMEMRGIPYLAFTPRSAGIDFYGDNLFTSEQLIRERPETVMAFRQATLKGWEYAMAHPDEIIDLIHDQYSTRMSREHLRFEAQQMHLLIQPDLVEMGYINPTRWEHIASTYSALGLLPDDLSLEGFIYEPEPMVTRSVFNMAVLIGGGALALALFMLIAFYLHNRGLRRDMILREAEEHMLRSLLQNAPFPVVVTSVSNNSVRFVNDRALQQFAIDNRELAEASTTDFWVRPEERERFVKDVVLYGTISDWETELKTRKGQHFWALLSGTRASLDDGPALIVAIHDVTERKRRDQELRQAHEELEDTNARLHATLAELETLARTDKLTGCWNRRHLEEVVGVEIGRARRYHIPLSLIVFDIDHFKQVNDRYGHGVGDMVLRALADIIRQNLRDSDTLARWGGEEFVVLATNTAQNDALTLAEKLRGAVQDAVFPEVGALTVSLGVSQFKSADNLETCFKRADHALYKAKAKGRNRVWVNGQASTTADVKD
ncbi:MAG: ABC transporter substrate-binding protein [Pseudomonadota bacterium]